MKNSIVITLLFLGTLSFAQQNKIAELFNNQFENEQEMYEADAIDKPKLIEPFEIKNDTLSFKFSYLADIQTDGIWYFRRTVHIKDVEGFIKDMNVLFIAKDGSVKETLTKKDANGTVIETRENVSHLFFTELRKDSKDNFLQKKVLKAFEKEGYKITSEYWYN